MEYFCGFDGIVLGSSNQQRTIETVIDCIRTQTITQYLLHCFRIIGHYRCSDPLDKNKIIGFSIAYFQGIRLIECVTLLDSRTKRRIPTRRRRWILTTRTVNAAILFLQSNIVKDHTTELERDVRMFIVLFRPWCNRSMDGNNWLLCKHREHLLHSLSVQKTLCRQ